MERETLLFERSQLMQKYQDRKLFRERQRNLKRQQRNNTSAQEGKKTRTSTRSTQATGHSDVKASKLSQLKRQREKNKNRQYSESEGEYEEEEDEDDYDTGYKYDGSEYEEDDEEEYDPYSRKPRYREEEEEEDVKWAEESTNRESQVDDFNKIKIGRSFVARYCFHPDFNEIVKGCYGRVNVGVDRRTNQTAYRMVKIEKVFLQKPYNMGKFFTNQYFGVTQGKDRKVFQMNFFSDGPITIEEFDRYQRSLDASNASKPSVYSLTQKLKEINEFVSEPMTDKLTDEIVRNRMVFNKKLSGTNAVLEKTVLRGKLQYAKENNNERDIAKYSTQLRNLEKRLSTYEKHHENDQAGARKLGALTSKNRKVNMDKAKNVEHVKEEDINFDSKADPFSRLKTRTKIYYQEVQKEENEKAKELAQQKKLEEDREAIAKKERELLLAKFRRLGGLESIISSIDIELSI
ncbi:hypothetical protein Kpol_507p10 [Vanderwaltozyma polyspora DSM 70294]|uniref:Plus3 domain-containing protein n=1 Tax=Vanderwaltozyma polyspora (strain ATCC 22028 / DSM 70294 / BCRC 21397 / CBS 2163 / NBRC 10782 / NRRL Y-8283 / UCD 57-17) TaxID=436907 RepID=A7TPG2_VANPO|nr:uncharacterized protein Kpol_507p10 [Vanderwaltozyma polyspora DSM 70294]EDO15848.1 hypothetical protein Kpol_507p10 [Vanderwaltozyma polyspora DSM 70294]